MALTSDEQDTLHRLFAVLDNDLPDLKTLDAYYDSEQRIEQLGMAVPPALRRFLVVAGWPMLVADAIEDRLTVEGFRYAGEDEADDELWRVWQVNDLDSESHVAQLETLIYGRSYVCVGSNEADASTPLVTVESPLEMAHEYDARWPRVPTAAVRRFDTDDTGYASRATLYLPDQTIWLEYAGSGWVDVNRDRHRLGMVPVVPLVNRQRTRRRMGRSELYPVMGLTDAAARTLTNLQVAQETHATPQRWVMGATQGDFVDASGNPLPAWEAYFGAVWAMANENGKAGQFSASDLRNFHETTMHYAHLCSGVSKLPLRYFGVHTQNPPSADATRADESELVKLCERKQTGLEDGWERAQQLVRRFQTGEWDPRMAQLETLWRDPATPTVAQKADAVQKLASTIVGGVPLLPVEMAREELGWSAGKRARARAMDEAARSDPTLERIAAGLAGATDTGASDAAVG